MPPAGVIPRPRARVTFGRSPKSDQKACLKPQVSRLPARLTAPKPVTAYPAKTKTLHIAVHRIAHRPLSAAAPASRTEIPCPTDIKKLGGPTGRTYTCRRWRQVRDLIIAQTGGRPLLSACHVSGSEGRRRGDSLRNLFAPQLQSDERNSKNHWFLAAFFPPFLPLLEEMGPPEASKRKAGRSLRPKVTRARGRGTLPAGGRYSSAGGDKKIVRSGKKILIFPVLSCKI